MLDDADTPPDTQGHVTEVVGKMKYAANKNLACQTLKHSDRNCTGNNFIRELVDSGSDGDIWFNKE